MENKIIDLQSSEEIRLLGLRIASVAVSSGGTEEKEPPPPHY